MHWLIDVVSTGLGPNPIDDPLLPPIEVDESLVTPGVIGFVVTLLVAVAAILIIVDMMRRVRRVRYRSEVRERLEQEQREADGADEDRASPAEGRVDGDEQDSRPMT